VKFAEFVGLECRIGERYNSQARINHKKRREKELWMQMPKKLLCA
jgi:hypothetical protein